MPSMLTISTPASDTSTGRGAPIFEEEEEEEEEELALPIENERMSLLSCASPSSLSKYILQHVRRMRLAKETSFDLLEPSKTTPSSVNRMEVTRNTQVTRKTVDATSTETPSG